MYDSQKGIGKEVNGKVSHVKRKLAVFIVIIPLRAVSLVLQ